MLPICNVCIKAKKPEYRQFPLKTDKSLGACLKRARLEREYTQLQVANFIGIGKDSYQNYEWNKFIPHIKLRKIVNEFLGYNYWDDKSSSLANRVLLYRIEHKLTMSELANNLNVSCHTIERIEKKEKYISISMSNKINCFIKK